jgi:hypothetical protein
VFNFIIIFLLVNQILPFVLTQMGVLNSPTQEVASPEDAGVPQQSAEHYQEGSTGPANYYQEEGGDYYSDDKKKVYHKDQTTEGLQIIDDSTGEELAVNGKLASQKMIVKILYCIG